MNKTPAKSSFSFSWRYVSLPSVFLVIAVVLAAVYYPRLPFLVAYKFHGDGSPDAWLIKAAVAWLALLPQLALTLGAIVVIWIIGLTAGKYLQPGAAVIEPQRLLMIMGNMVALPQLILLFAMLDVFSYNSYQVHLRPSVLVFALIVMVVGGIVLGVFFIQMMGQVMEANKRMSTKH